MARRKQQHLQQRLSYESLEARQLLAVDWTATVPSAQFWQATDLATVQAVPGENLILAERFALYELDVQVLRSHLADAPLEYTAAARNPLVLALPKPNGSLSRFQIVEAPIMHPALAEQFPNIKTFRGQGIDQPAATVRLDITEQGFHAQVISPDGMFFVDPYYHLNDQFYMSYYKQDFVVKSQSPHGDENCGCRPMFSMAEAPSGDQLFVYRLAVGATGEYTQFHGGTVTAGMSAIVTAVNRVTGVYEVDLTIRMELVPNNNLVVYTNPSTDPYTNNNGSTMLTQNQTTLDNVIGSANYDIGHVFSTGGGGVAFLGVVGVNGHKAKGVTGQPQPINDPFYIDYVAHEMGHQFGANHSFNGTGGSCTSGSRNAATAYEPGSGSTIMAYAGICGSNNLQLNSDAFFHFISIQEIRTYVSSGPGFTSAAKFNTGNSVPTVSAGPSYVIPDQTPFFLTANGSDANPEDVLTYIWEERDLGPQQSVTLPDNGSSPLFRSWSPTTNPVRYFPRLSDVLNNTTVIGEKYAQTNRTLNFRVTVRDNRSGGGGVNAADTSVTVVDSGTGFRITSQNSATAWNGNSTQTVTWNVSGTSSGAINTPLVDILFSADGGGSFSTVLASGVANNGSASIVVPNIATSAGRIMVKGTGNIFFDVNDAAITVTPVSGNLVAEAGVINVTDQWQTVTLTQTFTNPVVSVSPATFNATDPATVRIRNVTPTSFQIQIREWNYLDGVHSAEQIGYFVVNAGTHTLNDGTQLVAGVATVNSNWRTITLGTTLNSVPAVIATVASTNGADVVAPRIRSVKTNQFQIRLQEEQANNQQHGNETIHYLAMTPGVGNSSGLVYQSAITPRKVTHQNYTVNFAQTFSGAPIFLATGNSFAGADVFVIRQKNLTANLSRFNLEEEQSADEEIQHTAEVVGWIALQLNTQMPPALDGSNENSTAGRRVSTASETMVDARLNPYYWQSLNAGVNSPNLVGEVTPLILSRPISNVNESRLEGTAPSLCGCAIRHAGAAASWNRATSSLTRNIGSTTLTEIDNLAVEMANVLAVSAAI